MTTRGTQSIDDPGDSRPMLNTVTGTVSSRGVAVRLTRTEQAILARLMQSLGQVLNRERLCEVLYELRNKLARIGCADLIQTVWAGGSSSRVRTPVIALGLSSSEWTSLQIVVAAAERHNAATGATIRSATQRLAA